MNDLPWLAKAALNSTIFNRRQMRREIKMQCEVQSKINMVVYRPKADLRSDDIWYAGLFIELVG